MTDKFYPEGTREERGGGREEGRGSSGGARGPPQGQRSSQNTQPPLPGGQKFDGEGFT